MATEAQENANRKNAQLSTGPRTAEGKARVSHNAVKNSLTGATVLLPSDDTALYQQRLSNALAQYQPANDREHALVQSLVDTDWRLARIPALISGVYALGRRQHAELFANDPEETRASLLEAHVFLTSRRDLNNLSLQERRLRTHREKDLDELRQLQAERKNQEASRLNAAAYMYTDYRLNRRGERFDPQGFGFEFSMDEIELRAAQHEAKVVQSLYPEQYAIRRAKELEALRKAA